MPFEPHLLSVAAGALSAALASWLFFRFRLFLAVRRARERALDGARATLRGQVSEQIAPLLPEFPWVAADARFLGAPIDYVVFDGVSEDQDEIEVVLVEVKTGRARLSRREKRIRDAVEAGRVRFETLRL
jgi:predicted Holliday junction resolvase-like endonuclease